MWSGGFDDTLFVVLDLVFEEIVIDLFDLNWAVLLLVFKAIATDFTASDGPVTRAGLLWTRVAMFFLWTDVSLETFSPFTLEGIFKGLVATDFFNLSAWTYWWFVWAAATFPLATVGNPGSVASAPPLWTFVASFLLW